MVGVSFWQSFTYFRQVCSYEKLSSLSKVSLVEALERERLPSKSKTEPLLPLVRESRAATGHGILTSRQKRWMQSRPNESSVEKPVNFK